RGSADRVADVTTASPEWLLIREVLEKRSEQELQKAREALVQLFDDPVTSGRRNRMRQIALVGLRGAGKSTLGRMLAAALGSPFVVLSAGIERVAGCGILESHSLYGPNAYPRHG